MRASRGYRALVLQRQLPWTWGKLPGDGSGRTHMYESDTSDAAFVGLDQHGLAALHARIAAHFRRREARERAQRYLAGLLAHLDRKNGWQLAEALGEGGP